MTEEDKQEIHEICADIDVKIENYTINDDGTVDVDGSVYINSGGWLAIPFEFGVVSGNFDCSGNELKHLHGSPIEVGGDFNCSYNDLVSLDGGPTNVGGDYICEANDLTTLKGSPKEVHSFDCHDNKLKTLEHCPEIIGEDFQGGGNKLTTLKYSPKVIKRNFNCTYNKIYDLNGYNTDLECKLFIDNNPIGSLFNRVIDSEFISVFNTYKVIKDKTINLKRLKYVMGLFDKPVYLSEIEKKYTII